MALTLVSISPSRLRQHDAESAWRLCATKKYRGRQISVVVHQELYNLQVAPLRGRVQRGAVPESRRVDATTCL